ncbi:MAG: ClpXP protease specificity-enhancing factor SspB [Kiloniellales bacterium]|nr:ClpXP protease specificity-enhancing factor SspB [Kiloniellales bacterium]
MAEGSLQYEHMVEEALRGVVRKALIEISEDGLPGDHHFYITFRTDHPDTDLPQSLRERYPHEMTIVLQHQFWELEVAEEEFAITLSFSNVPHRLVVPFPAVIAFADPSVRFGLQFEPPAGLPEISHADDEGKEAGSSEHSASDVVSGDQQPPEAGVQTKKGPKDEKDGAKVVTLDSWRKK